MPLSQTVLTTLGNMLKSYILFWNRYYRNNLGKSFLIVTKIMIHCQTQKVIPTSSAKGYLNIVIPRFSMWICKLRLCPNWCFLTFLTFFSQWYWSHHTSSRTRGINFGYGGKILSSSQFFCRKNWCSIQKWLKNNLK